MALLRIVEVKGDLWNPVGGIHALPLSMVKEIEPGSPVMVVGYFGSDLYPLSLAARLVGETTVTISQGVDVEEFLVSASAVPGQSGSPVVMDDGSVIGIITAIVPVSVAFNPQPLPSGLNRVIKVENLQRLLTSK